MILDTARTTLLAPFDLETAKLQRIFGTLAARKVDYADLYFQYSRSEGWSLEEGIVKSGSFNIEQGVGVRAVSGEKTAFAYSNDISEASLLDAVGTEAKEITRRVDAYFGVDLGLDISLPVWRLVDEIKRLKLGWPDEVGPN